MRFFLVLLLSLISLSACTLPGTQTEVADNVTLFENEIFQISVPKTWTEAVPNTLPTPKKGKIELAYVSQESKYGYANNLIIMSQSLDNPVTSRKYSELNQLQTSKNYLEYIKISDAEMTFFDDEVTRVYVFEAKYNAASPRMKFVQTARVCGTTVYLLHFSLALDKDPSMYTTLLQSFQCK